MITQDQTIEWAHRAAQGEPISAQLSNDLIRKAWTPFLAAFANLVAQHQKEQDARIIDANIRQCSPNGYLREVLESNSAAIRNQNEA